MREVINIGETEGFNELSNFAPASFELDGISFASVEAFIQFIKYPESEDHADRKARIAGLVGFRAKRAGKKANKANYARIADQDGEFDGVVVHWQGRELAYGLKFCCHATPARSGFSADTDALQGIAEGNLGDGDGVLVVRVGREQPIVSGQHNQQVGPGHFSHHRR